MRERERFSGSVGWRITSLLASDLHLKGCCRPIYVVPRYVPLVEWSLVGIGERARSWERDFLCCRPGLRSGWVASSTSGLAMGTAKVGPLMSFNGQVDIVSFGALIIKQEVVESITVG
ncbi:hypothetical protein L484_002560 [Morus notabilis]|uniref:Uncharacterized protein n=1 Tax=Morus notabilis TaxID=981085 RepID=W9RUF5_9ROSA|nr:hypothetical protein L484_002560 [Morus notabilis]